VDREGGVVWLNDGVGNLGGWHNGEGEHDAVGVFLTDLGDQKGAHTGASSTTEGVGDLEALKAVTGLSLLADNIEYRVNQFSTLSVVSLGPVVTSTSLPEDKVVRAKDLAKGSSTNRVHGSGLKVHQHGAGHVAATSRFVEVHVDALQLKVGVTMVRSGGVNTMLIGDNLPELGTNLVATLATLNVYNLPHLFWGEGEKKKKKQNAR